MSNTREGFGIETGVDSQVFKVFAVELSVEGECCIEPTLGDGVKAQGNFCLISLVM